MASTERIPVIVGAAQFTQDRDARAPLDPLGLMAQTGAMALGDAGPAQLAGIIDSVWVANILSWGYQNAPASLAKALNLSPSHLDYSIMSGHTPQAFVNRAARAIATGQSRAVLLAGAEAQHAVKRSYKGAVRLDWPVRENPEGLQDVGGSGLGTNSLENSFQLMIPINMYALFETALRAARGVSPGEHVRVLGALFARFSQTASQNPLAWDQHAYSAETIATPGPANPIACHPYTRLMTANMNVDMSAALVMTSEQEALRLGIDRARLVYPMGGADLENIYFVTRRPQVDQSPAVRHAAKLALAQAGLALDEIQAFDLYSCFPSMVEIALQELGLPPDDPRPLTLTGGLPYFGGPMGNYSLHAIAAAAALIREGRIANAMITANGGFNTRHAIGVYGKAPGALEWGERDDSAIQQEILSHTLPEPVAQAQGPMDIEAYIIRNGKDGKPEKGLALGRLNTGIKTLAVLDAGPELLQYYTENELVGRSGAVRFDPAAGCNVLTLS